MSACPPIVYKYVDQIGASKIIGNRSLRFSRASDMNDPFDIYIDDLFNPNHINKQKKIINRLIDNLKSNPVDLSKRLELDEEHVVKLRDLVLAAPRSEVENIKNALLEKYVSRVTEGDERGNGNLEPERSAISQQIKNTGILCATRNKNNLLMWSHYSQNHRGVVLGFRPDFINGSFLTSFDEVIYSDIRPSFEGPIIDHLFECGNDDSFDIKQFIKSIFYSKSPHWGYEEELRIAIPNAIRPGSTARFLNFLPYELSEIYLGCRAEPPFRSEIILAARRLNPDVCLFEACPEASSYALSFNPIV